MISQGDERNFRELRFSGRVRKREERRITRNYITRNYTTLSVGGAGHGDQSSARPEQTGVRVAHGGESWEHDAVAVSGRDQSGLQKLAPSGADVQMARGMETLPIASIASATQRLPAPAGE